MKRLIFSFLLFVFAAKTNAQVFGGNPTSLKFYQLTTDTVRVIFPKSLEKQAREVAWLQHQLVKNNPAALGTQHRKFNVVLQNQTTASNAYVGPAPWRSEFYMMPDLNNLQSGALPWHRYLALHEFRHVEQFSNFNRTIPKLAGVFFGQEGQAVAMNLAVPEWFWEGDAVWQETMSSEQGRGRLPSFFNSYRSLWLAKKNYSYQKLRNGSYRHFVPNHYDLGYLLVTYGREKFGNDLWTKVNKDALDFKKIVFPFQKAVQKYTGVTYKQFVNDAFSWYKTKMQIESQSFFANMQTVTKADKNNVRNYLYPIEEADGSVLVLKTSYRQVPTWVRIHTNGHEEKLRPKDIAEDQYYSYRNGKIVYTAFATDARWEWKTYSVLKIWNPAVNEIKKITSKTRLFQPDLSPDASKVIAVNATTDLQTNLQMIGVNDSLKYDLPNPEGYVYSYPKFSADGLSVISAVRNQKGEMSLLQTNLEGKEGQLLFPFSNTVLGYVQVSGDTVVFTAPQNGRDALYLYDLKQKKLFRAADLPNGNYQASLNTATGKLLWNTFTADGYMLLKQNITDLRLTEEAQPNALSDLYVSTTKSIERNILQEVKPLEGTIKRYRSGLNLFNIHSWRPYTTDPDYGITFFSNNILNTMVGEYSYNYNRNEASHGLSAALVYGGLYPQLSVGASQTWSRSQVYNADTTLTWNVSNVNAGVTLPFNFTGGLLYSNLTFSSSINAEQMNFTGIAKRLLNDRTINYTNSSISWVTQTQKAYQQIYPKFANVFSVRYRRTVNGQQGSQVLFNAGLYLPGLLRNHSIVLFASAFSRDTLRGGLFSNNLSFARGFNAVNLPRMWRVSANYHFPIVYPEFGIANLIYFLRVRGNLFYDYTHGRSLRTGREFPFESAGGELYFDTRLWNVQPFTFGVRYSRLLTTDVLEPGKNPNQFELILPIELF
ncbi:hypothetical protein ESA94_02600 [Lacibacter luteus]|uniref:Bacterial surface antigen (D15) domain-containing protein n=1 Tax=Lacibacter luteus TaxID=2508719 RepID=A0A4Q1CMS7_9BACT|nr:hypothetical protein [Lacibacter luteus]RXK61919.1 hypothetical protein ESA94_02600 [Lacibacter luteus]